MASHGHFHWNELLTDDVERAKKFYAETIGWTFLPLPMENGDIYWVARLGDTPAAGFFPTNRPGYEDVPELMRPIFDVKGVGRIAILTEPGGAGIGWITPVQ